MPDSTERRTLTIRVDGVAVAHVVVGHDSVELRNIDGHDVQVDVPLDALKLLDERVLGAIASWEHAKGYPCPDDVRKTIVARYRSMGTLWSLAPSFLFLVKLIEPDGFCEGSHCSHERIFFSRQRADEYINDNHGWCEVEEVEVGDLAESLSMMMKIPGVPIFSDNEGNVLH